jgi:flavin reductase (DIM6/NTAB) family NADH-FMN oxidoreductase RutF
MELDLETTELADRAYPILASLVTPRPIALVTTISADGKLNAAPFSFFNLLGANPPICAFAPGDREDGTPKDTARNVRATHEFVVNLVDEAIAEAMNQCAASLPFGESELTRAGLHAARSSLVKPPRIAESPPAWNASNGARCKSGKTASSLALSSEFTCAMNCSIWKRNGCGQKNC